jgi:hypothetical protein
MRWVTLRRKPERQMLGHSDKIAARGGRKVGKA